MNGREDSFLLMRSGRTEGPPLRQLTFPRIERKMTTELFMRPLASH